MCTTAKSGIRKLYGLAIGVVSALLALWGCGGSPDSTTQIPQVGPTFAPTFAPTTSYPTYPVGGGSQQFCAIITGYYYSDPIFSFDPCEGSAPVNGGCPQGQILITVASSTGTGCPTPIMNVGL